MHSMVISQMLDSVHLMPSNGHHPIILHAQSLLSLYPQNLAHICSFLQQLGSFGVTSLTVSYSNVENEC